MISVCLATYNGEQFVEEQMHSILSQLGERDELVVSDDGSTDDTVQKIEAFADTRIRLIHNEGRHGVVGNFEHALSHARGDILFLSDQDDVWLAGKVAACVKALETSDLVLHNLQYLDDASADFFTLRRARKGVWHNLYINAYTGCCMAFRREVLAWALPFPRRIAMHDQWLGLVAELKGRVTFLPQKYVAYRRHEHNASFNATGTRQSRWVQLQQRFWMAVYLLRRWLTPVRQAVSPREA